ncbi:hypothetical protein HDU92_000076 [Lobulomyces angularis]|nr:hypothetical protein HDU92_000076 [Lobulomyces angularis]
MNTDIKIIKSLPMFKGKWLKLMKLQYVDGVGTERSWESCERVKNVETFCKHDVDAVDILGLTNTQEIVLVIQYRPPVDSFVIEFPSGLVDPQESIEESALRELKEETGYVGKIKQISRKICYEPGLTSSCSKMVNIFIDLNDVTNIEPKKSLEVDEFSLKVKKFKLCTLLQDLLKECEEFNYIIDSRLWSFAQGLALGSSM